VTFFAWDSSMKPDQRELRRVVIERYFFSPAFFVVARFATRAELAFMRVIGFVTGDACRRQLVRENIAFVAAIAFDGLMRVTERKLRRLVVIEADRLPLCRGVACGAFLPVATGVDILNFVAIKASPRQVFIPLTYMTDGAPHIAMCTLERELGLAVIEGLLLGPGLLGMAGSAVRPKTTLVNIVGLMAGDTGARRFAVLFFGGMALAALHRFVGAAQFKI
jgi:hypothetical protein